MHPFNLVQICFYSSIKVQMNKETEKNCLVFMIKLQINSKLKTNQNAPF
jgi:hypothetical protein